TIGMRVVYSDLDLATALFILIVAPEAYLPVRQVGAHFHDSVNGVTAAKSAFALIDGDDGDSSSAFHDSALEPIRVNQSEAAEDGRGQILAVKGLTHTYPGAGHPALAALSFAVKAGEVVAITGPSGCGKTTALSAIMGFLTPTAGEILGKGQLIANWSAWRESLAFVGQQPRLIAGTVADNVRLGFPAATDLAIRAALDAAGGGDIELDQPVNPGGSGVSVGQTRRIAIARAVLRVTLGRAKLLIMDEPTAGLDADAEAIWLSNLHKLGVAALVVTHRTSVLEGADRVIRLEPEPAPAAPLSAGAASPKARLVADAALADASDTVATAAQTTSNRSFQSLSGAISPVLPGDAEDDGGPRESGVNPDKSLISRLFAAVPHSRSRLAFSILLAFAATAASVALMAFSAWLIARAGEHPNVAYLTVAATMVRFFGVSRGAFRYLERLFSHGVALRLQSALRFEIYSALSKTTLLGRSQGELLSRVVIDAESIANLIVRVWIPFASSALVICTTSAVLSYWSPTFAVVLLLTSIAASLLVPLITNISSKKADAAAVVLRGELANVVTEINFAATDLVAYAAQGEAKERFTKTDARLQRHEATSSWVLGVAEGAQVLAAGATVIAALWIGGALVVAGTLEPVMFAVLVLTPLALHESLSVLTKAAQTFTATNTALKRTEELIKAAPIGSGDKVDTLAVGEPRLLLNGLSVGWPGGSTIVHDLNLGVNAGERVALVGPSGVGKTTVATTVLGMIPPVAGEIEVCGSLGYLAQDSHIFSTSVEENVKIGNKDATDEQVNAALRDAGMPDIDPKLAVGETGQALSGGEARRLALARLLVGDYQVLILDEPTEHLDQATSEAVMDDIWKGSTTKATLVITHDPSVITMCDWAKDLRM
ncbi:MAG: thiol reductant ABC exporter subunit CydC, partial [Propionibacteriaceae bacterium]|nr:thiol reductant ABC exporter subunit CydC [Propionibacteriaceae bacterium]